MVRIRGSHPRDPGSSPGDGTFCAVLSVTCSVFVFDFCLFFAWVRPGVRAGLREVYSMYDTTPDGWEVEGQWRKSVGCGGLEL